MKKLLFLLLILPGFCLAQNSNLPGQANVYEFSSFFHKSETRAVQKYLDRKLNASKAFAGTVMDATITLENGMTFYILLKPGTLKVKFDRNKNSLSNYLKMKEACQGLKSRLG